MAKFWQATQKTVSNSAKSLVISRFTFLVHKNITRTSGCISICIVLVCHRFVASVLPACKPVGAWMGSYKLGRYITVPLEWNGHHGCVVETNIFDSWGTMRTTRWPVMHHTGLNNARHTLPFSHIHSHMLQKLNMRIPTCRIGVTFNMGGFRMLDTLRHWSTYNPNAQVLLIYRCQLW